MLYSILADLILVIHLSFVVFVVVGGFLALRWRWLPWLHIPAAVWGVALEFGGWICPLTPLENWLREAGGDSIYQGGFIEHYLLPLLYPADLTRLMQLYLGVGALFINAVAYTCVWRSRVPAQQRS